MGYRARYGAVHCSCKPSISLQTVFSSTLPHRSDKMRPSLLQILLLLCSAIALASSAECPPKVFESVKDFDIKKYVSAPWYIQEQVSRSPRHELPAWHSPMRHMHSLSSSIIATAHLRLPAPWHPGAGKATSMMPGTP